jgi:hypothetical protein
LIFGSAETLHHSRAILWSKEMIIILLNGRVLRFKLSPSLNLIGFGELVRDQMLPLVYGRDYGAFWDFKPEASWEDNLKYPMI